MNILVFSTLWPDIERPTFGIFVRNRILALARRPGVSVRVVSPVAYFPGWIRGPLIPERWRREARIADFDRTDGVPVYHPRYFNPPKIGMSLYGHWMAAGARSLIERLHADEPIDLIDAHYAYPDGAAALRLGSALGIPVFITARGTDINLFTRMPFIRPFVRRALQSSRGVIAVSRDLERRILELGIDRERVTVISNGVDGEVFSPRDRSESRRRLGLDTTEKIVLSVAALIPLKRIELLIEAFRLLSRDDARLIVVGEGPERARLEEIIRRRSLNDRVKLIGQRNQSELADWYSAADLFCLASSREGSPNVIREALACGLPVVAADVGGVSELIADIPFCRLVTDCSPERFAGEISRGLNAQADRRLIANSGRRSWDDAAQEALAFYARCGIRSSVQRDRKGSVND